MITCTIHVMKYGGGVILQHRMNLVRGKPVCAAGKQRLVVCYRHG
jgi:hypothetical protein